MREVKQPTTYEEQIALLRSRNCIIDDEEFCKEALATLNYYRFSAYFLPFRTSDKKYIEGTTFRRVYHIYEFDRKLRNLLFKAIEVIEVDLRSQLAHYHAMKYGALGYMDPNNFSEKHDVEKFLKNIKSEITKNKKNLFVKHHLKNYGGQFPIWVIIELFTFGMLSYFYSDLITQDQKVIARIFNTSYTNMKSWLKCCTDLRNICAHYGRLYYRVFDSVPGGMEIPEDVKCRLWGSVLTVKELYPFPERWNAEFIPQLSALFDEYSENIDLCHIAFPEDWEIQLEKTSDSKHFTFEPQREIEIYEEALKEYKNNPVTYTLDEVMEELGLEDLPE